MAQTLSGLEQGMKPYGSYEGGDIDSISMVNGNLTLHIPLISFPQRGGKLKASYSIVYNNPKLRAIKPCRTTGNRGCTAYQWFVNYGPDDSGDMPIEIVPDFKIDLDLDSFNTFREANGTTHSLLTTGATAGGTSTIYTARSVDASGYLLSYASSVTPAVSAVLTSRSGIQYDIEGNSETISDTNGNFMKSNDIGITWTDTLGRTLPQSSGATSDFSGCQGSNATTRAEYKTFPGISGGTTTFKVCYASFTISFNVCGSDTTLCSATSTNSTLPQSVVLPNGTAWTFEYDTYGSLSQIGLPTGGTISYGYATTSGTCVGEHHSYGDNGSIELAPYGRAITSRTVNANDGTGSHVWTYSMNTTTLSGPVTTTVYGPLGSYSVHAESVVATGASCSLYETELDQYDNTGTLLQKTATTYSGTVFSYSIANDSARALAMNVVPVSITHTDVLSNQVSKVTKQYDSGVALSGNSGTVLYGNLLSQNEYDIGTGSAGSLLRTTTNTYMAFSGPNASSYLAKNLLSLPYTTTVTDGSGNQVTRVQYNYDENSRVSSGLSSNYHLNSVSDNYLGNNTSVLRWLNSGSLTCPSGASAGSSSNVISKLVYFDTGTVYSAADPCGHATTTQYSSTYWGAYPTSIANALGQTTSNSYDFDSGLLSSATDPNGLTTSYGYDSLWRLAYVHRPDGGSDTIARQESSTPFITTLTSSINSSTSKWRANVFDGLGRVVQTQTGDPQGTVFVDTVHDANGRISTVSNPYRSGSDASSSMSSYKTTYGYDGIGRKVTETYPDSSVLTTAYCGSSTLVTDPA